MKVELKGMVELQDKLLKCKDKGPIKTVVRKNGASLQKKIVANAVFKGHYEGKKFVKPTGTTKRSVIGDVIQGGMGYETGPTTNYAPYPEFGTRFMEAQPFVKPAFDEQKTIFKSDLEKLVK